MCSVRYRFPRDQGWQLHCTARERRGTKVLMVGYWLVCAVCSSYWLESEVSSSESMSGGSGLALNDGVFLGVCFFLVNVNVPESLKNSVRAAIPLGCLAALEGQSLGFCPVGFLVGLCFVGLRDGGILLEMANHCFLGTLCQSWVHAVWVVDLAQQRANALDVCPYWCTLG